MPAPTTNPTPMQGTRARGMLLVVGVSVFFALLFATQSYVRDLAFGPTQTPDLGLTLFGSFSRWLLYAALAPAVAWLAARYPVQRGMLARRLPLHVLAAAAFATVHSAVLVVVFRMGHVYPISDGMPEAFRRIMIVYFGLNFLTYCGISGAYHAFRYYRDARQREVEEVELRASLTDARLDALKAQLNPHFLFNTLNATSALALTGQVDQVVGTLSALSDLLRVSLDRDMPQEVTLERELEILAAYLAIQRIRFGDRLTLALEIDDRCVRALVPSMVLQPLLENALEHGVARRPGPGGVTVRATRAGERLTLRVEDTGPGFAAANGNGARQGIGLANTVARLEHLYAGSASIERGNLDAGGAFVELVLPLRMVGEPS
jgi:two-component system LytT family sensor kinase